MSNEDYMQKIQEGDQSAFRLFVDMYSKDLYNFALGYVSLREVAEEVISDVFLEVWNNRSRLDEIRQMKSWLLVMVRNKAISYLRKQQMEPTLSFDEIEEFHVPVILSPDHEIISKEEIGKINEAIATLPPKCKEVFVLAKIEKMPYKEISEMLNISEHNCMVSLTYHSLCTDWGASLGSPATELCGCPRFISDPGI